MVCAFFVWCAAAEGVLISVVLSLCVCFSTAFFSPCKEILSYIYVHISIVLFGAAEHCLEELFQHNRFWVLVVVTCFSLVFAVDESCIVLLKV